MPVQRRGKPRHCRGVSQSGSARLQLRPASRRGNDQPPDRRSCRREHKTTGLHHVVAAKQCIANRLRGIPPVGKEAGGAGVTSRWIAPRRLSVAARARHFHDAERVSHRRRVDRAVLVAVLWLLRDGKPRAVKCTFVRSVHMQEDPDGRLTYCACRRRPSAARACFGLRSRWCTSRGRVGSGMAACCERRRPICRD